METKELELINFRTKKSVTIEASYNKLGDWYYVAKKDLQKVLDLCDQESSAHGNKNFCLLQLTKDGAIIVEALNLDKKLMEDWNVSQSKN